MQMHNEKKYKEVFDSVKNYQQKPIVIIKGVSGIGKLFLAKQILLELSYNPLEIDSSYQNVYILKKKHPLIYCLEDQLHANDKSQILILKEIPDGIDFNVLRSIQKQYSSTQFIKPLIIIVNITVLKEYQLIKILGLDFIKNHCISINLIPPTSKKIEKYLKQQFPKMNIKILQQVSEMSNGDLRNAYNQAFIFQINFRNQQQSKDSKISFFNTIGRVLYNKRLLDGISKQLTYQEMISKPEPKFYFDPFELVDTLQVTQQAYRGFIFTNSIKFFHDLTEMQQFYDVQCEADKLERSLCRFDRYQGMMYNNQSMISQLITLGYMMINKHIKSEKQFVLQFQGPQEYQFRQKIGEQKAYLKSIAPFKSYQEDLVSRISQRQKQFKYQNKLYLQQLSISQECDGTEICWYEDTNDEQKIKQNKVKPKFKFKENQAELIERNKLKRKIDMLKELQQQ